MIDVHQNAALSESFEGDRSRVIGNRCNKIVYNGQCKLAIFFLIERLLWMPTHSVRKCCVKCSYALQGINKKKINKCKWHRVATILCT